jgi:hypothetical protein
MVTSERLLLDGSASFEMINIPIMPGKRNEGWTSGVHRLRYLSRDWQFLSGPG